MSRLPLMLTAWIGALLAAAVSTPSSRCETSDPVFVLAPHQELFLGWEELREFKRKFPETADRALKKRVQQIGWVLAEHADRENFPYRFHVYDHDQWHVGAYPGGEIVLSSGAVRFHPDDDELAFVLAHEIAHIALRHHVAEARISRIVEIHPSPSLELTAPNVDGPARSAIAVTWGADAEAEADEYGALYLARAGLRYTASISALTRLGENRDLPTEDATHRPFSERVAMLERSKARLIKAVGLFETGTVALKNGDTGIAIDALTAFSIDFPKDAAGQFNLGAAYLSRSRSQSGAPRSLAEPLPLLRNTAVRIRSKEGADPDLRPARVHFEAALKIQPNFSWALAGLALIELRTGEYDSAEELLREALQGRPNSPELRLCLGNLAFLQGNLDLARLRYREALVMRPDWSHAIYNLARSSMTTDDDAAQRLRWAALADDPIYCREARQRIETLSIARRSDAGG